MQTPYVFVGFVKRDLLVNFQATSARRLGRRSRYRPVKKQRLRWGKRWINTKQRFGCKSSKNKEWVMKTKKLFRWAGAFTVAASTLWAVSASANHFRGVVWIDSNCNGIMEAGELGVPGVVVEAHNCSDGTLVATATTAADGTFIFYEGVNIPTAPFAPKPGPYQLCFKNLPAGFSFSPQIYPPVAGQIDSTVGPDGCAPCFTFDFYDDNTLNNAGLCQSPPPPAGPLSPGDTATIGFWHNKNGQALIKSFNGGPTATMLGTWLANNYGCLFGNLSGQPNTVVAAQFLTYFGVTGEKTYAQIMAGALASYATSSTLGGGSIASGYGFAISPGGTGDKTYDVGSDGAAIGLMNNTSYTVAQLLSAANANCSGGLINPGAFDALNNIFDGINSSGDIK